MLFRSIGGVGITNMATGSYGGWIDYDKWGVSFSTGAGLSNEDPTSYIYGKADKYTAGSTFTNFGIHRYGLFASQNISLGVGIQKSTNITTNGYEKGSTLPYVAVGFNKETCAGVFRFEALMSKIPIFGLGWGVKF